ncbi:MAG: hypothetical protein H7A09_10675 [Oceanospirillaceae bacterium]|nr:hypothetical protein [Chitinophagales bacterium]MCP5326772.1 hypothetical protein [Oceanospirillaceae bacterium]
MIKPAKLSKEVTDAGFKFGKKPSADKVYVPHYGTITFSELTLQQAEKLCERGLPHLVKGKPKAKVKEEEKPT